MATFGPSFPDGLVSSGKPEETSRWDSTPSEASNGTPYSFDVSEATHSPFSHNNVSHHGLLSSTQSVRSVRECSSPQSRSPPTFGNSITSPRELSESHLTPRQRKARQSEGIHHLSSRRSFPRTQAASRSIITSPIQGAPPNQSSPEGTARSPRSRTASPSNRSVASSLIGAPSNGIAGNEDLASCQPITASPLFHGFHRQRPSSGLQSPRGDSAVTALSQRPFDQLTQSPRAGLKSAVFALLAPSHSNPRPSEEALHVRDSTRDRQDSSAPVLRRDQNYLLPRFHSTSSPSATPTPMTPPSASSNITRQFAITSNLRQSPSASHVLCVD
eukprot:Selendium_serpulae@DN233_c0_g1_i1.p1